MTIVSELTKHKMSNENETLSIRFFADIYIIY